MSAKNKVYNLIILDESGSMESIKTATISGFNELIQSIRSGAEKNPELQQFIQFFSFNSNSIKEQIPLSTAAAAFQLNEKTYIPNSMTPLYDAIGHAVSKLRFAIEKEKDYAVLVTILTDGAENDSKEYTRITISNIIRELEKQDWVFTYMGAHADAASEALSISIQNHINVTNNSIGIRDEMSKEKSRRQKFYNAAKSGDMDTMKEKYFDETADQPLGSPDKQP